MAVEPQTRAVTLRVHPGGLSDLSLCNVTNIVTHISTGGVIEALNKFCPGSVEVGDRIVEVGGKTGNASQLIRSWIRGLRGGTGDLHLKLLRPAEFDVDVDISEDKVRLQDLGLGIAKSGFVTRVRSEGKWTRSEGQFAIRNAPQCACFCSNTPYLQCAHRIHCVRTGDRIVRVSGREVPREDGATGDVMPYLRLALAAGVSPLRLRIRRGDMIRPTAESPATLAPYAKKAFNCLLRIFKPSASLKANVKFVRNVGKAEHFAKVHPDVFGETLTPSTKGSSERTSSDQLPDDVHIDARACAPVPDCMVLPGVVRRIA